MAVFNPTVPQGQDNMPNWTNVTKPISQPEADVSGKFNSTAVDLSNTANILGETVTAGDQITKDIIKKDVRSTLEPIREDFTNDLLAVRQQQLGLVPSPVQTGSGSTATDVLPSGNSSTAPPAGVTAGLQKIASLQNFMDSGKANDTYYDMRLKTAVTQLRDRYPGYIDYIDANTSAVVGVNPANATVQNLMADINKMQTNKATALDKAIDKAMTSGFGPMKDGSNLLEDAPHMVQKLRQQGDAALPEFEQWYAKQSMYDAILKRQDAARKDNKGTREDIADQRGRDYDNELSAKLTTDLDKVTTIPGISTPGKILDMLSDAAANHDKYTDAQMRQLGVMVTALGTKFETQARQIAMNVSKDAQGRSYSYNSDVGPEKIDAKIAAISKVYTNIGDALTKGGVNGSAIAFQHAIHAQSILGDTKDSILSNADVGSDAAINSVSRELFGDTYVQSMINRGLLDDLDKRMRPVADSVKAKIRLGFDDKGNPVTLADSIKRGEDLQAAGKITPAERARYTGSLVNLVDDFKDPNQPTIAKERLLKSMFTTKEGQSVLGQLGTDYTDPVTNQQVPGKYSVWTRFTAPDFVKEIKKMSPESQQIYKNWVEKEAGAQLFQKEFFNLNHFTGHDDLHFKYYDGANGGVPHIELISDKGSLQSPVGREAAHTGYGLPQQGQRPPQYDPKAQPNAGYIMQVQKIVARINDGMAGLARAQKEFGGDPNAYLLDFLTQRIGRGVDAADKWEGKLADAIAASRAPRRRIEDTFDNLNSGVKK